MVETYSFPRGVFVIPTKEHLREEEMEIAKI